MDWNFGSRLRPTAFHCRALALYAIALLMFQELLRPAGFLLLPFPLAGGALMHPLAHFGDPAELLRLPPALPLEGSGESWTCF